MCVISQIHDTVEQVNVIKLQREFYLGFAENPQVSERSIVQYHSKYFHAVGRTIAAFPLQKFINDWLASQSRDLKVWPCRYC